MSQKARYTVQCSEAGSWSELDIDETFPESQLDFARAKCDALLGAIEQSSSTKSIFQPETRELVTQPTAAECVFQKTNSSVSLSSTYLVNVPESGLKFATKINSTAHTGLRNSF